MCPVKPKLSTIWPFTEKNLWTPDLDIVKLKIRGKNVNSIYMSLYRLKDHYTVSKISCKVLRCFFLRVCSVLFWRSQLQQFYPQMATPRPVQLQATCCRLSAYNSRHSCWVCVYVLVARWRELEGRPVVSRLKRSRRNKNADSALGTLHLYMMIKSNLK